MNRLAERTQRDIVQLCYAGLDPFVLLERAVERLQPVVPIDAWCCMTTDPATLLHTGFVRHEMSNEASQSLMYNELMQDDVNKFKDFARAKMPLGTLFGATRGVPERSIRYRDIFAPIGLGDELRGVLKAGSSTWGSFCFHREAGPSGFSDEEASFVQKIAPHLGEGIRAALLLGNGEQPEAGGGPGLLTLNDALRVLALTPAAEQWLAELDGEAESDNLPAAILSLAVRLQALESSDEAAPSAPWARVRTRRGRWLTLHASRLSNSAGDPQIAIIFELARPVEVAPLLLDAYSLTPRETEIAQLVLQGCSTEGIADDLCISALTVQQHLKSVFEKLGVRSRRELVAQVYNQQYLPRALEGERLGSDGSFDWAKRRGSHPAVRNQS
jgi:DNA-binding CsgD family transcriptional regulator